jgi:hypothetical protein
MRRVRAVSGVLTVTLVVAIIAIGIVGYAEYEIATTTRSTATTTSSNNPSSLMASSASSSTTSQIAMNDVPEGPGPISTWPSSWMNVCNITQNNSGNSTTSNSLVDQYNPELGNLTLDQLYSRIINSTAFQSYVSDKTWVTTYWGTQEDSGLGYSANYVVTQFILISGGRPSGYLTTYYNIANGSVTTNYQTGLTSSCPEQIGSFQGATFNKPSPAYYETGESILITFSYDDYTVSETTISSANGCSNGFDVLLEFGTTGPLVYNSTEHVPSVCPHGPLNVTIHPGQTWNQTLSWNQTFDNGTQVPSGAYEIVQVSPPSEASGKTTSSPIGVVYLGTPVPITETEFDDTFEGFVNTDENYYNLNQPVKISGGWTNNGQQIVDIQTNDCTLSYQILNLTNGVTYNALGHLSSCGNFEDNPVAPSGSIEQTFYWNQTADSGARAKAGVYQVVYNIQVESAGHLMNQSERAVFEIGEALSPSGGDHITISSSSINSYGYLSATFVTTPNLKSVQLYSDGVSIESENYSGLCCAISYQLSLNAELSNQNIPPRLDGTYVIVLVGIFADGSTSITWATPIKS